jgi:hypothetical protein
VLRNDHEDDGGQGEGSCVQKRSRIEVILELWRQIERDLESVGQKSPQAAALQAEAAQLWQKYELLKSNALDDVPRADLTPIPQSQPIVRAMGLQEVDLGGL